jgi:hypothetical protein
MNNYIFKFIEVKIFKKEIIILGLAKTKLLYSDHNSTHLMKFRNFILNIFTLKFNLMKKINQYKDDRKLVINTIFFLKKT